MENRLLFILAFRVGTGDSSDKADACVALLSCLEPQKKCRVSILVETSRSTCIRQYRTTVLVVANTLLVVY